MRVSVRRHFGGEHGEVRDERTQVLMHANLSAQDFWALGAAE